MGIPRRTLKSTDARCAIVEISGYTLCCRGRKLGQVMTRSLVAAMQQIADWLKKPEERFCQSLASNFGTRPETMMTMAETGGFRPKGEAFHTRST